MISARRIIASIFGVGHWFPVATTSLVSNDKLISPKEREWDFVPYYQQHVYPTVEKFEQSRVQALKIFRWRRNFSVMPGMCLIAGGVFILFGRNSWHNYSGDTVELTTKVLLGLAAVLAFWVYRPRYKYKQSVKQDIYPTIFRFFGDDFDYKPAGSSVANILEPSGIIPNYTSEHNEDFVMGRYQDVSLSLVESKLIHGSGKHRRTVFKGIFIRLAMNKNFSGHTVLLHDTKFLRLIKNKHIRALQETTLEDPEFESRFDVLTNDPVEARYLLTPSFMERLLHLECALESKGLQASFYENHLLLMIPSGLNRFEGTDIHEPVTFYRDINVIMQEMSDIFAIIEHLKLHEHTRL